MSTSISRSRLHLVAGLLAVATFLMSARIAVLQVIEHPDYVAMASAEHWGLVKTDPRRGTIRDRNGYPLATSVVTYRVLADTTKMDRSNPGKTANLLAPVVGVAAEKLAATLAISGTKQLLSEKVSFEAGNKIASLKISGVRLERQVARTYPEGNVAAGLLGMVGVDHQGLAGIEVDFNQVLGGKPGQVRFERDPSGEEIPLGYREETPAEDGADLILTIDRYIQRLADAEADAAMVRHKAEGVTILVMEPATGAVLAMATRPSFDLLRPNLNDPNMRDRIRNRAVTDVYEPGSIFKIITMAAALQEKLVSPSSTYQDNGYLMRWGRKIVNWDGGANGLSTMTTLLVKSSNVGAVLVAEKLGNERFYRYVHDFGFGQRTNIDLGGEADVYVRTNGDSGWSPFDLDTNSFGQGIAATPIQMITAVSAIANGGKLMQPYVVKEVVGPSTNRTFKPVVVRNVIAPDTAKTLVGMMTQVVNEGATKAVIDGYKLAGKSGTTQVQTEKGYSDDQTIASFTLFPAENPPFVILVRVDRPKDTQWGGQVAAPIARTLAERLLAYYRIPPNDTGAKYNPVSR